LAVGDPLAGSGNLDQCFAFGWRGHHLPFFIGFAVFADALNAAAVGAPLVPGLRIFSPDPAAIRAFLAAMLAYKPALAIKKNLYRVRNIGVVILVSNPEFQHDAGGIVKQYGGALWPRACRAELPAESRTPHLGDSLAGCGLDQALGFAPAHVGHVKFLHRLDHVGDNGVNESIINNVGIKQPL